MKKFKDPRVWDAISIGACAIFVSKLSELTTSTYDCFVILISGAVCFGALRKYSWLRCRKELEKSGSFSKDNEEDSRCDPK